MNEELVHIQSDGTTKKVYFVEYNVDTPAPMSHFVIAEIDEAAEIQDWLNENHADDEPWCAPVYPITFEEFKKTYMEDV